MKLIEKHLLCSYYSPLTRRSTITHLWLGHPLLLTSDSEIHYYSPLTRTSTITHLWLGDPLLLTSDSEIHYYSPLTRRSCCARSTSSNLPSYVSSSVHTDSAKNGEQKQFDKFGNNSKIGKCSIHSAIFYEFGPLLFGCSRELYRKMKNLQITSNLHCILIWTCPKINTEK